MNDKEIQEIRRRFRSERSMISNVCGCYVNEGKKIIATFNESLGAMPQDESDRFLGLLKKSVSGTLGRNLVNIEFSTKQVMEGEEYKLLAGLRQSELKDEKLLHSFYERVAETLKIEGNYLIILTHDTYSVPYRSKDDSLQVDASDEVFSYVVCSICPIKLNPAKLSFQLEENRFHALSQDLVVAAPELGFMFPLFDDRAANIYGALYYTKNVADNHQEFIDSMFSVKPPMPAAAQKQIFQSILKEALEEECAMEVVQAVHEQLSDMIDRHKESRDDEQLLISQRDIEQVLKESGVSEEHINAFGDAFIEQFGEDAEIPPMNVIDKKQFIIHTPDATIKINPEKSDLVELRWINGSRYILIPADSGVEVNGVSVQISPEE